MLGSSSKSGSPILPKSRSPISPIAHQSSVTSENQIVDINIFIGQIANFYKDKIKNDDLKMYLCGNSVLSSDHITTQLHQNNKQNENRRLYDKYHVCYYCGTCVIKMGRHFIKQHATQPEVEKIDNMGLNSQERKNAITLLTLKGDFLHNCAVLVDQKGVLLVLRRPDEKKTYSIYRLYTMYLLSGVYTKKPGISACQKLSIHTN